MDQGLIFHPKILTLGEKREEEKRREGGGAREETCCSVLAPGAKGKKEPEREKVGEGVFNPNNSQPKRLNYP